MARPTDAPPEQAINDPIGALVQETRELTRVTGPEFARTWLLRALRAELHRYSMEDDHIDIYGATYKSAEAALTVLDDSDDWIHPKLNAFLGGCREVATMDELPVKQVTRTVGTSGHTFDLMEQQAQGTVPFAVSNTTARRVPIIEANIGSPQYCRGVLSAFVHKIDILKAEEGVSHLGFIEKEMGPVGAISMVSSLVSATNLPACIYRETHWGERAAIAGHRPDEHARIAIIYDLIVTGAGICNAADIIKKTTAANTKAAVVLCGYGARRTRLTTENGQSIRIEALAWNEEHPSADASRDSGEARNLSEAREGSREEVNVSKENRDGPSIPPGFYTAETLPPISNAALVIVERVRAAAKRRKEQRVAATGHRNGKAIGLKLADKGGRVGVRFRHPK